MEKENCSQKYASFLLNSILWKLIFCLPKLKKKGETKLTHAWAARDPCSFSVSYFKTEACGRNLEEKDPMAKRKGKNWGFLGSPLDEGFWELSSL